MARHDAGWWADRVAELEATGDAVQVARRYGLTVKHLKWWRWKLRSKAPSGAVRERARKTNSEPRLLPVVVAPAVDASTDEREPEPAIVIETTRGRISIRGSLSAEQLGAVVAELVRGC